MEGPRALWEYQSSWSNLGGLSGFTSKIESNMRRQTKSAQAPHPVRVFKLCAHAQWYLTDKNTHHPRPVPWAYV